jgi:regulator of sigma E protease
MSAPFGAFYFWRHMNTSYLAGLIFFIAFAGMILVHELGHFLASRLFGVDVEEFGFGLPPRILRFWRAKGSLTVGKHMLVIPPNFNLPFDADSAHNQGVEVTARREAERLVLDTIALAATEDGQFTPHRTEPTEFADGKLHFDGILKQVTQGTEFTLNWLPIGGFVRPKGENDPNVAGGLAAANPWKRLGVLFAGPVMNLLTGLLVFIFLVRVDGYHDLGRVQLAEIAPNSPAEASGMLAGDIVLSAAGQPVDSFDALSGAVKSHLGQPMDFVLQRGSQTLTVTSTPRINPPENEGALGIIMGEVIVPVHSWSDTLRYGAASVYDQARAMLLLPAKLLRGTLAPEEGRFIGMKGIYDIFNLTVSTDMQSRAPAPAGQPSAPTYSTLYLVATLTITIGLFNLFPFPALDGGRIIFAIPELIFRRRIPHQFENAVHAAGMMLLLLLMLYINVMDFINPLVIPTPAP